MLKENQLIDIKIKKNNIKHYRNFGYKCELGDVMIIAEKNMQYAIKHGKIIKKGNY